MGFNCGVVGLPNVGKSTIFNALTKGGAQAANYPFCTIDPNVGIVPVVDPRLANIQKMAPAEKLIMTTVEIVDIAGLVKGAAQGEGLGNKFLSHIGSVDAILEVVRVFEDDDVTHVMGGVDPARDVDIIQTELVLKDMEIVTRQQERLERVARSGDKNAKIQMEWLSEMAALLNQGKTLRGLEPSPDMQLFIQQLNLLTQKPILYVANVKEDEINTPETDGMKQLQEIAASENSTVLKISGRIEEEISQLEDAEKEEFLKSIGLEESGLDRLVREGHRLLGLAAFFTIGPTENRAWTVKRNASAPEAAGKIHSDFQKGFIRAEVMAYDDFVKCGSEAAARAAGKLRIEGKEYIVQDGDIMHFRFSV